MVAVWYRSCVPAVKPVSNPDWLCGALGGSDEAASQLGIKPSQAKRYDDISRSHPALQVVRGPLKLGQEVPLHFLRLEGTGNGCLGRRILLCKWLF